MPSADSCGDPLLEKHTEGFLPMGCGPEAVFNFSWDKKKELTGSGDDDDDGDDIDYPWPTTTIIPTGALLSTASQLHRTQSSKINGVGIISVTPSRSVSRLPPRFTPSPESRHSSFQQLLRIHLNSFNRRLSMLEGNTLDMKESIHSMEKQQSLLSSQLKELLALQPATEKNTRVNELEKSYTDMEARLSRLEGRLEILIDGFTALAQEMNKMKRTRHISRSLQEKRVLPSLTTVIAVLLHSTPQPQISVIPTKMSLTSRATVPKSIPTPGLLSNKHTSAPKMDRKLQSASTTEPVKTTTKLQSVTRSFKNHPSTRSAVKFKTTQSKPKTISESKPQVTKKAEGRRTAVTAKHMSQPRQAKLKEVKEESTITKFQVEPPTLSSKPARIPQLHKQSEQANKKDSALLNMNNKKAVISDAPGTKKDREGVKSTGDSTKLSKPRKGSSNPYEKKTEHKLAHKLPLQKTRPSAKDRTTTTKPVKATAAKKPKTTVKRTTPAKIKATAPKKKLNARAKQTLTPTKSKAAAGKKKTEKHQQKRKKYSESGVSDLLRLLRGDSKSAKQKKNQEDSLHIVLGKLAIPIKIIPDN